MTTNNMPTSNATDRAGRSEAVLYRGLLVAGLVIAACCAGGGIAHAQKPLAPRPAAHPSATPPADGNGAAYYHYTLAKNYEAMAQQSGRQDYATQAIEEYKLALGLDPTSRRLQDGLADLYFRLGRIREAVAAAKQQVALHPDDAAAHDLLGKVYLRSLGDGQQGAAAEMLQLAIGEYETIARLKPKDLETHLLLGQLYSLNHDTTKAEQQFKLARALDGGSQEVALSMARLYSDQGDLKKAAAAIESVPAGDRTVRMDLALAGIYDSMHDTRGAVATYKLALAQEPDNTDAQRGYAAALLADGQLDAARAAYAQLAGHDPDDAQSLVRLAEIQRQQGQYEQALTTLTTASSKVSGNAELDYNLALTYDALGRFPEALKAIAKALDDLGPGGNAADATAMNSNRAMFLDREATIDRQMGHTSDAIAAYGQMAQVGTDFQSRAAGGIVDTYRDAHDWKKALQAAAAAAKTLPADKDIQLTYARQLADNGELPAAVKLASAQLKGTPDDKEVFYTLADMYMRAGEYKAAYDALDKVAPLAKSTDDQMFLDYYRGTVADKQKMYDQAEAEFRKGLTLAPDTAAIENDLGYMLAERGKQLPEAVAMLQKAVAYDPQNGAYLDSLAWAYYKQGQYALAEETERRAVLRSPNDPAVLDHLGQIYEHNGKLQLAVEAWSKAVAGYATLLPADAEPVDVKQTTKRLDAARVRLAHAGTQAQ